MDFISELKKLNIEPNDLIIQKFEMYYNKLIEVNEYMNLTAITEKNEVYLKHFLDSLSILKAINKNDSYSILDVGSGAGFPSIPLAIVDSKANVVIIDALNKRINFLNELVKELGLNNVNAYHKRAEEYTKEKRESFDYVTARAVARLNILAELCLPLVKIGGSFIAMKGQIADEELKEAKKAIEILGGKVKKIIDFDLPDDAGKREIIIIEKVKATPNKYPRDFNKIKGKPL